MSSANPFPLPPEFLDRMKDQLGGDYADFQEAVNLTAPISLRLHPQKGFRESPFGDLQSIPWIRSGRYLNDRPSFTLDPLFHAGSYYVQEASSMLLDVAIRQIIDNHRPIRALDLCGAPGGKSTLISSLLPPNSLLLSNEVIQARSKILMQNLERWGFANQIVTSLDSKDFESLAGYFDLILVDAPCSGEGLFRKDPQARKEWSPEHVALCAARQQRILRNCIPLLAKDGHLIYSTCTYNDQENESNARWLQSYGKLAPVKINLDESWGISPTNLGYQVFPNKAKGEGFYFAVLQNTAGVETKKTVRQAKGGLQVKGWAFLSKNHLQIVSNWINEADQFQFIQHEKGQIRFYPKSVEEEMFFLRNELRNGYLGTALGEIKGDQLIPDHGLAMSLHRHSAIPSLEVDKRTALEFLKGAAIRRQVAWENGWHLVCYQGQALGWAKVLPNRINNYFPKGLRIRMEIPKDLKE